MLPEIDEPGLELEDVLETEPREGQDLLDVPPGLDHLGLGLLDDLHAVVPADLARHVEHLADADGRRVMEAVVDVLHVGRHDVLALRPPGERSRARAGSLGGCEAGARDHGAGGKAESCEGAAGLIGDAVHDVLRWRPNGRGSER